ncbi:Putative peroxisomal-coenzyme A synthetase [Auxenochlorella protothecoides]|uniref:Lipid metabolism related protein n=1 Tax=Auxenochlorella protothecoides TaxID=3075 RepID=V5NE19_AUXPR|nr:Putative peroxisomal-coenzyme A synthetase [Auxenochlorella protothecoides]AHA86561.1 lipid metabolism related protein [Auxenochlorella protothecoides]KFM25904.1 Putative peroxisomal-coenzyme A synthetase [Auxenochlorella protothecoides]
MSGSTLLDVLGGSPDSPAIVVGSGGQKLTRGQFLELATQFAQSLRASGVQPSDLVTIVDSNTLEFAVAFLGTTLARAVAAPLNQNYHEEEFKYYQEDAGSTLVVVGASGNRGAEAAGVAPAIGVTLDFASGAPVLQLASRVGEFALKTAPAGEALADPPRGDDVALFLHTSGTTSRPKGVPLTHANLTASLENIRQTYEFTEADVSLLAMPLFHVHGLMAGWLAPLSAGASVVFPAEGRFAAGTFWKDAAAHGVTFYTAVPTIHQILVQRADRDFPTAAPPPLRVIRSCSSSLAPATLEAVEAAFGAPVLEAYAMTEASHQMTSNPLPQHGPRRPGTVGRAQGSVALVILGPDHHPLPAGEVGEVCIRGPNVTAGYRANPAANEEAFAGGWFHTGDQGRLDAEGYLQLTGRIKELINRGGEKISPIEVDGALLSHRGVAEAVAFAAPDAKYGETVAAAVVLNEEGKRLGEGAVEDIKRHVGTRLSAFKIPTQIFITDELPKTATGKIQRRFMVDAFINKPKDGAVGGSTLDLDALPNDGYYTIAKSLRLWGSGSWLGPEAVGIRFISFRNEQSAGYAAAAAGYLSGIPGVLLTVSGPGVIHALAGLSHAQVNTWPLVLLSGSCETGEVGKGSFQELDQVAAVRPYTKFAGQARAVGEIPAVLEAAFKAAVSGRPGGAYVDVPSDGAAWARAEGPLRALASGAGLPALGTAMGRGVVPDTYEHSANAARSLALAGADVALVFGARLNWQLHFGEAPKWAANVKFVLVDVEPSERDARVSHVVLRGDAGWRDWTSRLAAKSAAAREKLGARLARTTHPLDYGTTLRVVRDALATLPRPPLVVAEGANTMDNARLLLEPVTVPRTRLDAGTWGTMGVGLGYAIASATQDPGRATVAVEGDSAFGFSGMEVETIVRYGLPAFGGRGVAVGTAEELAAALREALASGGPSLIDVTIDPQAGVESGNVHAFNFKPPEK